MGATILVVDDDREMRGMLAAELTNRGFSVETAVSGGEAVEKLGSRQYELVLLDLRMPLMDGLTCLDILKYRDPLLQVILMSGEGTLKEAVTAMRNGACHFLEKPLRMEELLYHIQKALEKRRLDALAQICEAGRAALSCESLEHLAADSPEVVRRLISDSARLHAQLQERMKELTVSYRELDESKDILSRREKLAALGEHMLEAAHEINNPLTAMIGFAELMLDAGGLSDELKEGLDVILREGLRCRKIASDILAQGPRRKPEKVPLDLEMLCKETLKTLSCQLVSERVSVKLSFGTLPRVPADPDQLTQVLINLLRNAVQAMRDQDVKSIEISARLNNGRAHLEVTDSGPGISPNDLRRIFQAFYTTKGAQGGTGIGLSVSKQIIEAHGGSLIPRAESPGHGATFEIELPLYPSSLAA